MELKGIIKGTEFEILKGNIDINIAGIEDDSRKVSRDNMFIAIEGFTVDGHDFIEEALERGANCIVVQKTSKWEKKGLL